MAWHTDPCLLVLRDQVDQAAPNRSKASDGTKGDEAHQGTDSAHNPDPSDGDEVDALDLTHDPANGADMGVLTEALRVSRDDRLHLVIFNERQFSSYAKNGIPPFTWRPYSGSNKHTRHAHVETNDKTHDESRPWKIGIDAMNPQQESWVVAGDLKGNRNVLHFRLRAIQDSEDPALEQNFPDWDVTTPGLKQVAEAVASVADGLDAVMDTLAILSAKMDALSVPQPAPVDPAELKAVLLDPEVVDALD